MSVATGTAVALGVTAAAGVAGSAIAANAQGNATDKAVSAQNAATAQTADYNNRTLDFNQQVYANSLANQQPYMTAGNAALGALSSGLENGSLTAAYPGGAFHYDRPAPGSFSFTPADFQKDPAYQFNMDQGIQAQQRLAASQGGLISGGALKDAATFASGLAANTYQQQFGDKLAGYQTNTANYQQNYSNALAAYQQAYNQFENTQSNTFNRLAGVAGLGQAAASNSAASGVSAAGTVANANANAAALGQSGANNIGGLVTGQGNATGAATMAGVNGLTGAANQYANYLAQQQQMTGSSYNMTPYRPTYPVDPATGI